MTNRKRGRRRTVQQNPAAQEMSARLAKHRAGVIRAAAKPTPVKPQAFNRRKGG